MASTNLFFAEFAACFCNYSNHEAGSFNKLARSIALPYDSQTDYTPAHNVFKASTRTKEADTILLRYPLNYQLNDTVHRNNLRVYAANLDRIGAPSTTYAVQNIVRLSLGDVPTEEQFVRSYEPYVRGDFKQWTQWLGEEIVVRNHVAGAGGFLQQILIGYAGIRELEDGLVVEKAVLPLGATKLIVNGEI